jgi:very-short-patch-repair endonuclease
VAGGQLGILLREFEKKRRHLPIRQLLLQAGEVIQTIKPVFMMSPLSIAKFIPPGSLKFDLVIFDEASQVEPVDAFGALLRARQAVVVGDNKQLPPTRFFERVTESEEVESSPTADLESILGLFCSQGVLQRMLRWHYRSRHESLIRVSNHQFYDGKLVLFPSPDSRREEVGLVFRYLPHTAYEPGLSKRYNLGEALAVAQAVMRHARDYPELTLGVAAFSQAQAQAIDDQLEILRRRDPSLERFFAEHREEPFFVKNLENVQGDERDVIFISVGYGKQADGYMAMSFGPLNWDGGERRLNVLITRARRRCVVFANFRADDIDLSRTSARGVVALKRYLKYAETGIDDLAVPGSREPDSEFEIHVAREIEKLGYQVVPQVGTGGFFIDLAVVDPEQPGRYLLGIECDGATYHSAKSVRDRDRLRQAVLENLGWTLHRIWSTDWFRNPEQELRRLEQAIKSARNERKASTTPPLPPPAQEPSVTRETGVPAQAERAVQPYEIAQFELDLGGLQLHEVPVEKMADWVERVVEVESPIHVDELARRVTAGAGLSRTGSRIQRKVLEAALWALLNERIRQKGDFYFSKDGLVKLRDRSELPPGSKNIAWVAPEEIHQAALLVVTHSFGISREEAVVDVARLLGFQRTGSDVSDRINGILDQMVTEGFLTEKENHLRRAPVPDLEAKQTAEPGAEQDGAEGVQQAGPTLLRLYSMMSPEEQAGLRRQLSSVNTASVASSASLEGNGPVDPISNDPCATDAS